MSQINHRLFLDATWHVQTSSMRQSVERVDQSVSAALVCGCIKHNNGGYFFEDNVTEILTPYLPKNNFDINAENLFAADTISKNSTYVVPEDICVDTYRDNNRPTQRADAFASLLNRLSEFANSMRIELEWSNPVKSVECVFDKLQTVIEPSVIGDTPMTVDFLFEDVVARVLSGPTDLSFADFDNPDVEQGDPLRWMLWACSLVTYWETLSLMIPQLNDSIECVLVNTASENVGVNIWGHGSKYGIDAKQEFISLTNSYWESLNETVTHR